MLFGASKQQPDKYPDAESVLLEIIVETLSGFGLLAELCLLGRYHHTLIRRYEADPNDKFNLRILQPALEHRPN